MKRRILRKCLLLLLFLGILGGLWTAYQSTTSKTKSQNGISEEKMVSAPALSKQSSFVAHEDSFISETAENGTLLEKTASLTLLVEDMSEALTITTFETESRDGKVQQKRSFEVRSGVLGYSLTLLVPAEELEGVMLSLKDTGTVVSEFFQEKDVAERVSDLETQLAQKKAYLTSLQQLLEQKSDEDLSSLLQINQEITRTQSQIDQMTSQKENQLAKVAYATLTLTLRPQTNAQSPEDPAWSPEQSQSEAFLALERNTQHLYDTFFLIIAFVPLWGPVLLILGLLLYLFREKTTSHE